MQELDEKSMTNDNIARFFNTTKPVIQNNPGLHAPRLEGWFRTHQHFRWSLEHPFLHETLR